MLEVNSTSKGILIPNVALTGITDAITIALPAASLLVYNTATVSDVEPGYYYNSETAVSPIWTRLATKAYVDLLEAEVEALKGVKDIDNNRYDIITIGTQTWMAENLKTTRYNDGTVIPLVTDRTAWGDSSTNNAAAYCWYNAPNETSNLIAYGALYNWYAINSATNGNKNVCPVGWHVPTDVEWTTLTDTLGGVAVAGGKMKEAGLAHWLTPNTGATNESGFAGLPGGSRSSIGIFSNVDYNGYSWSSTENSAKQAWFRNLFDHQGSVSRYYFHKGNGFSVRCLRD
jgi:uncharacterized protein (TIGR02145 family)